MLAAGKNVNMLVLDTEVYSNTGGQMSKSTPRGAIALFAAAGKPLAKKDIGLEMMSYGSIYIARVAMGASQNQCVKAFAEAEAFDGPSLIIAYSHCIAHGIDMAHGLEEQERAVNSGHWILFRYNPDLAKQGKNPLQLDCKDPSITFEEYASHENRWRSLKAANPQRYRDMMDQAQVEAAARYKYYKQLAELPWGNGGK